MKRIGDQSKGVDGVTCTKNQHRQTQPTEKNSPAISSSRKKAVSTTNRMTMRLVLERPMMETPWRNAGQPVVTGPSIRRQ